jgi:DNA polymerase I
MKPRYRGVPGSERDGRNLRSRAMVLREALMGPGVEEIRLFLVGGSYQAEGSEVLVELYGRTPEGRSVTARVPGFHPWFDLLEPQEGELERLRQDPEYVFDRPLSLWIAGRERPAHRIELRHPWVVPEFRRRFERDPSVPRVLSCDIPFAHRFLYDHDSGLTVAFEAEDEPETVRARYTTERVVRVRPDHRALHRTPSFTPPLRYLAFDLENSIRTRRIYCLCGEIRTSGQSSETFRFSDEDERELLRAFFQLLRDKDPDIVTGYNIGGYDLPLILERAEALGIPKDEQTFGRDLAPLSELSDRTWRIHGRVVADAWWSARQILHPKQETLQYVAEQLLGEGKLDVDRRNMDREWERDPDRVLEYCERDARLALDILLKLRALDKAISLAEVTGLYLDEGLNGRTSTLVDALLIREADRRGIGVPPSRRSRGEAPIEGGYVHALRAELVPWVVVLDFKAMYPSIIISRNICFTTRSPEGPIVAPNGARFLSPEQRRGLIPDILRGLLAQRDRFKLEARNAPDPDLARYYEGLQGAVKVLMNSFYGVLASSFYRFTDKEIGAAITAFARQRIQEVIAEVQRQGAEVIYSDTDSIFVRSPEPNLEAARAFGERLAASFSKEGSTMEFQAVYSAFFSHGAKKRYVAKQVWPTEALVVRGYETRRTDSFDLQSEALTEIFELILDGRTEEAKRRAQELVQKVRRSRETGEIPPEKLVIARTVRPESEYEESTKDSLPFLRLFRRMKEEGYDVFPGTKIAGVVVDARAKPMEIEPFVEGRPFSRVPDYEYYAERLAQTLARVTEVFGWDAESLLRGARQRTLSSLTEEGEPEPSRRSPDPPAAGLTTPAAELLRSTPPEKKRSQRTLM